MYMTKYPCVYMRGGTSKAVFFHEKDLPEDKSKWDEIFMKVMGTPDVKQIDGMGGTVSSTSKIAVISPSDREDVDVNYTFRQVDIVIPRVDGSANCGNISSAVGPFAIDEGLVPAVEPITVVRILNTNTNKIIEEHVRVKDGKAMVHGDEVIKGVPGTGSRIDMYFEDPAGSKTGKLFPTGQKKEIFDVPGYGPAEVTVLDCSNPMVFIKASDLGIKGTELVELNQNKDVMEHIERFRGMAACFNSRLNVRDTEKFCRLGLAEKELLRQAFDRLSLSARAYHRLLRTARTIADLAGEEKVREEHILEALGYRPPERGEWLKEVY